MNTIKCVVVGDGTVGKTCLLMSYAKGEFPVEYVPTVFDNYAVSQCESCRPANHSRLFDTAGQEDFGRLRVLSYTNTDVFLVCFSVISPTAFENIKEKWVPEIAHYCPKTPFVLVGTQIDQRDNEHEVTTLARNGQRPVIPAQGEQLARELKAAAYVECSALTREGLNEVFVEAIYAALHTPRRKRREDVLFCRARGWTMS